MSKRDVLSNVDPILKNIYSPIKLLNLLHVLQQDLIQETGLLPTPNKDNPNGVKKRPIKVRIMAVESIPRVLTIAGSDSAGCAGIQADLKTFAALGVHGMCAITATTAQDTCRVHEITHLPPRHVSLQIDTAVQDIGVDSIKTGMLPTPDIVGVVSERLRLHQINRVVVDPVICSGQGIPLVNQEAISRMKFHLFPLALVLTPNLQESEQFTGQAIKSDQDIFRAGQMLMELGPRAVIIKGGHSQDPDNSVDILFMEGRQIQLHGPRLPTKDTHGSGCTFASAIAAHLAQGRGIEEAAIRAKKYVTEAIRYSLRLGKGNGPLGHFHAFWSTPDW